MRVFSGLALALVVLAWSLVKVVAKRLFDKTPGLEVFHRNYDADRLPPLLPEERKRLPAFSGCVACGLCDLGEGPRIARSEGRYPGLMAVVLASSRSMPDFDAAADALEGISDDHLRAKERVCPTRVPFVELARFVRDKAAIAGPRSARGRTAG